MELNKIYNEDCVLGMKKLSDNSIDLIVTSPPYNLNIQYAEHNDAMTLEVYYDWCKEWIKESFRVLKPGGRFCLQIGCFQSSQNEPTYSTFTELFRKEGFIFREFIIWNKNTIPKRTAWGSWKSPSNPRISPPFEMIINFHKISPKILEKGETDLTKEEFVQWTNGLWVIGPESAKRRNHPAPFPEELVIRCIKMHSYIGSVVLDPFNGSGTTTKIAKQLNRDYIGFDITKEYCNLAEDRIN
jgi:site-specific DNA-methyltransferase (adenine-specific)